MDRNNPRNAQYRRKINAAVQRGLNLCRQSVAPIVSLALVIDELHADPSWTDKEVREVEVALRRILARIVKSEGAMDAQGQGKREVS
jgi:hypothetical protein